MVFDELQNELEAMSKNESSVSIRVTGKHLLWLLDFAKAQYKNDIELAKLQGRNDVLKEILAERNQPKQEEWDEYGQNMRTVLKQKLIDLDFELDRRTSNVMRMVGINTLGDLVSFKEKDIKNFRNIGAKSMNQLQDLVDEQGLVFGMNVEKYKLHEK